MSSKMLTSTPYRGLVLASQVLVDLPERIASRGKAAEAVNAAGEFVSGIDSSEQTAGSRPHRPSAIGRML